jgi:hypothetical protein
VPTVVTPDIMELGDEHVTGLPFGRRKFMRRSAAALFGLAISVVLPANEARATHLCVSSCCRSDGHCQNCCRDRAGIGCPGGGACWFTCVNCCGARRCTCRDTCRAIFCECRASICSFSCCDFAE